MVYFKTKHTSLQEPISLSTLIYKLDLCICLLANPSRGAANASAIFVGLLLQDTNGSQYINTEMFDGPVSGFNSCNVGSGKGQDRCESDQLLQLCEATLR